MSQHKIFKLGPRDLSVPSEWQICKIEDHLDTTAGGTPRRSNDKYYGGTIPWVKSGELKYDEIWETEEYITEEGLNNSSAEIIPPNTPLISIFGTSGQVGYLKIEAATNQAVLAIMPKKNNVVSKYVFYYLQRLHQYFMSMVQRGAQPNLNQGIIRNTPLLLPTLPEQRKIAAILSSVDRAIEATQQVITKTERLKKSLRKKLMSFENIVVKESKLKDLLREDLRNGNSVSESQELTNNLLLNLSALGREKFYPHEVKHVPRNVDLKDYRLELNDILISRSNTIERVGYVGLYKGKPEICHYPDLMIRIRLKQKIVLPEFFVEFLRTSNSRKMIKRRAKGTSGSMLKINQTDIKNLIIKYPSIEEQEKIISKLSKIKVFKLKSNNELVILQRLKKSLMQQLLTGKIRVKTN